jgi:hypothetical protein
MSAPCADRKARVVARVDDALPRVSTVAACGTCALGPGEGDGALATNVGRGARRRDVGRGVFVIEEIVDFDDDVDCGRGRHRSDVDGAQHSGEANVRVECCD